MKTKGAQRGLNAVLYEVGLWMYEMYEGFW